jgi:hypothetical protein
MSQRKRIRNGSSVSSRRASVGGRRIRNSLRSPHFRTGQRQDEVGVATNRRSKDGIAGRPAANVVRNGGAIA